MQKIVSIQKCLCSLLVISSLIAMSLFIPPAFADESTNESGQTGSGRTNLVMRLQNTGEYGGTDATGEYENPDLDGDDLGDNLAFTVPTVINLIVAADGSLQGPSSSVAYIENESPYSVSVSSVKFTPSNGWVVVEDALDSTFENSVDLKFGPKLDQLNASSFLNKTKVTTPDKWMMGPRTNSGFTDRVQLEFSGHINKTNKDLATETLLGQIEWYVTPGVAS